MINFFKRCITIIVLCSPAVLWAKTEMFFVNKTPYPLTIAFSTSSDPKGAALEDFAPGIPLATPNQRIPLMSVPRGGLSLDPSVQYTFNALASGLPGDKKIGMSLKVSTSPIHGVGKTSSIQAASYLAGKPIKWKDTNATRTFSIGNKTFALDFKWVPKAEFYQDIEYTLNETGTITDPKTLTLLQYNIQQRPSHEGIQHTATGIHSERSELSTLGIPPAIRQFNADVVTVNEAFTASLRPPLIGEMREIGYIHATEVLGLGGTGAWSGGVMIFSKYPITKQAEMIYQNFAGADKNANKGVLYARIDKGGVPYNIFATHTNASYDFGGKTRLPMTDEGRIARAKQFKEMSDFIKAQNIPSNEAVIMVGDMNVDMHSEKGQPDDEYQAMLTTLNATHPPVEGHKFTLDSNANEWADPEDGPAQYLDYALYSNAHLKPKESINSVFCLKSDGADKCVKGSGNQRDLSDHFPLLAEFTL